MDSVEWPQPEEPAQKKPTLWVVLAGVLALVAVGLGIWAFTLQSDLDDSQETVDQQSAQLESQEQAADEAKSTGADLVDNAKQAFADESAQLESTQQDTAELEQELEQATDDLANAEADAADAQGQADQASAEVEELEASASAAKACAQAMIDAFSQVFDAPSVEEGVDQAVVQLQQIESPCQSALEG